MLVEKHYGAVGLVMEVLSFPRSPIIEMRNYGFLAFGDNIAGAERLSNHYARQAVIQLK